MTLTPKNIKKFARTLFAHKTQMVQPRLIHPARDWLIGLIIGGMILGGVVAWSTYMYLSNRTTQDVEIIQEPDSFPVYRAAAVSDALDYFDERAAAFAELQGQTVSPVATTSAPESLDDQSTTTEQTGSEVESETDSSTVTSTEAEPDVSQPTDTSTSTPSTESPEPSQETTTEEVSEPESEPEESDQVLTPQFGQ